MILYLYRLFSRRLIGFFISVTALSISIAGLIACLVILENLENGRPKGVNYQGKFISIFSYISSKNLTWYLTPQKILSLQEELDDQTQIIAVNEGDNFETVNINEKTLISSISFVSDNFFDVLKIKINEGNRQDFYKTVETVCLVSKSFIKNNNLSSAPTSLLIDNKQYKIIGVVPEYKGLFPESFSDVDIWIPWQHAHHILSRKINNKNPFGGGEYWAILTSTNINLDSLESNLSQLESRTDLLKPPEDSFKSIKGLVNQVNLRSDAEESTMLYLYISLVMFIIAVINLSTWVALTRLSKINNERIFLKLGIGRYRFFSLNILAVIAPIIFAFILAIPLYKGYLYLILQETTLEKLFTEESLFHVLIPWKEIMFMILVTVLVIYILTMIIAKLSNVAYNKHSLSSDNKTGYVFHSLFFITVTLTTVSLIFSIFIMQYALLTKNKFSNQNFNNVYSIIPFFENFLDNKKKVNLIIDSLQNNIENITKIGISSKVPYSDNQTQNFSLNKYEPTDIKILVNKVDKVALSILGVNMIVGENIVVGRNQLIVDTKTESKLKKLTHLDSILNLTLYDMAQEEYQIVGISSFLNYSSDPTVDINIGYTSFKDQDPVRIILLKGNIDFENLINMTEKLRTEYSLKLFVVNSLEERKTSLSIPLYSRIILCLTAAVMSVIISMLTIVSIISINVSEKNKALAIYSSLGLTPFKLWLYSYKVTLIVTVLGFGVGTFLYWKINQMPFMLIISRGSSFNTSIFVASIILMILALASMTIVFFRLFYKHSIFDYLRNND